MPVSTGWPSTTSLLNDDQQQKLTEIARLFEKAEIALKDSEHLDTKLNMPCVNELRYAGYHIAKAVTGHDINKNIEKAEGHCKRAIYDAHESNVVFLLESIMAFQSDYANSPCVSIAVAGYPEIKKKVSEISKRLNENKGESNGDRDKYYESCAEDRKELKEIEMRLTFSRDDVNALEAKERRSHQQFIILAIIGVLAIVAEIGGTSIWNWFICLF